MQKIICISGTTASGKSKLAFQLASKLNGSVIVMDPFQTFKDFPVLSNTPPLSYTTKVPYPNLNTLNAHDTINSALFIHRVWQSIDESFENGKIPIIEGGSMFYFNYFLTGSGMLYSKEEETALEIHEKEGFVILSKYSNFLDSVALVKLLDSSVADTPANDLFRLSKKYAIAKVFGEGGNNLIEKRREQIRSDNSKRLDKITFYKYFLYQNKSKTQASLTERVVEQFRTGLLEEVNKLLNLQITDEKSNLMKAIGRKEIEVFLRKLADFSDLKKISVKEVGIIKERQTIEKRLEGMISDLVYRIFVSNRKLVSSQLKWAKPMTDFSFVDVSKVELNEIVKEIERDYFEEGQFKINPLREVGVFEEPKFVVEKKDLKHVAERVMRLVAENKLKN